MTLTSFQKNLVGSILAGKCNDIQSFLHSHCDLAETTNNTRNFYYEANFYPRGIKVYVPNDDAVALARLKEFVSLWDKLDRSGLIYSSSIPPGNWSLPPILTASSELNTSMLSIIKDFNKKEIVAFPELSDFVARGHFTSEEYFLREENRDRKRAQRLTLLIAVVSILATLAGAFLQYMTYTTDRTVYIKNARAFSDTTKVIILNQPVNILDTNRNWPRPPSSGKK